jgi:hypothetical protein
MTDFASTHRSACTALVLVVLLPRAASADDAKTPQVHLVVDGEAGVRLERRQTVAETWVLTLPPQYQEAETWEVSCVAPCSTTVDAGSIYRVNGSGVSASHDLTLPQGRDLVHLHLVPHSSLLHGAAIALTIVGGIVALFGVAGLVSSPVVRDAAASANLQLGGWIGVGAGAAMMAVGIPTWIATYSYARVDSSTASPALPLMAF